MDALRAYLEAAGMDSSSLDDTVGDYVLELAREGGTEDEMWSVLEGCYPELEESPGCRERFAELVGELSRPSDSGEREGGGENSQEPTQHDATYSNGSSGRMGGNGVSSRGLGQAAAASGEGTDEDDIEFLREMMPHVSERGLRHVLTRISKGDRSAAASYLLDHGTSRDLRGLEDEAEAYEKREAEDRQKAEESKRRCEQEQRKTHAELEVLKKKIVGQYADEVEGVGPAVNVVPSLEAKAQRTRYRDGKVVTTTGAKVIVEELKPEWDGGSRGKVKTKGKRGKGFV